VLTSKPITYGEFDTLIFSGEVIDINGELFSEGGQYVQTLTGSNGCDSILTIRISLLQTAVYFSLDECNSFPSIGTDSIYTEFTPEYPEPISCADMVASIAYRDNPGVNRHSCTPGVEDSPAICISSDDQCEFSAPNEKAFVFEITVTPAPDTVVALTGLSFYERAPEMYDWISGPSGPNNYPTMYGVRVLKDGVEIYRDVDLAATTDWTLEEFDFRGVAEFIVEATAVFRFELLGYCLVGNGAPVAAWDLDEIRVQASCGLGAQELGDISGRLFTENGQRIKDAEILLSAESNFNNPIITISDADGVFMFSDNLAGNPYYLRAQKHTDYLEGVSTLDLIALQKHLLGLQIFDSPMQYLAADANSSESVSVLDLVDLRKLILGHYTELPNNASWRFGKAGQDISLTDPWDFEQTITIQSLTTEMEHVNFFGVKIGDVNRSLSGVQGVQPRSTTAMRFAIVTREVAAGETTRIDINAEDLVDLAGFQIALNLDHVRLVQVINGSLDMEGCHAFDAKQSVLKISWSEALPHIVVPGQHLFSLVLEPLENGKLADMVSLNTGAIYAEAYLGKEIEVAEIQLNFRSGETSEPPALGLSAYPNPFYDETVVQFYLEEAAPVRLRVMDVSGRLLVDVQNTFVAGHQSIRLLPEDLKGSGNILFCLLQVHGSLESIRLVNLK
jgi:hypothetical protein